MQDSFDKARDKNKEWCEAGLFGMPFRAFGDTEADRFPVRVGSQVEYGGVDRGPKFTWVPHCWEW